ncbi:hypothetical protein IEQ34_014071 [Dendrobium chrysotoxum]|uniref:Uncharacterized protein n=1 Tax=Dendrobium chrysotoxum TaxID=161865 RepID=A0AAV7G2V0_DENCH|nr:hypothetical protein IEQ34_014071 [Dendrobium chrysotoxum]
MEWFEWTTNIESFDRGLLFPISHITLQYTLTKISSLLYSLYDRIYTSSCTQHRLTIRNLDHHRVLSPSHKSFPCDSVGK